KSLWKSLRWTSSLDRGGTRRKSIDSSILSEVNRQNTSVENYYLFLVLLPSESVDSAFGLRRFFPVGLQLRAAPNRSSASKPAGLSPGPAGGRQVGLHPR